MLLRRTGRVVWLRPFGMPDQPERWRPGFGVELADVLSAGEQQALERVLSLASSPRCTHVSVGQ